MTKSNNDGMVLSLKAHNAYLYETADMTQLMVATSQAVDNSIVHIKTPGSEKAEHYTGTFNSYIGNKLNLDSSNMIDKVASTANEITVEHTPVMVHIKAGAYTWSAAKEEDKIGITRIAAPYKATFKPVATRYELDKNGMESLKNTFSHLFRDDVVYRISGTEHTTPEFGYMSVDNLLNLSGVSQLNSGIGTSKHKAIKVFKLANGLGLKLGDSVMIAVTEANPRFNEKESLFVKQEDPDTKRWYLEPVKIKISKGFNPNLKQFAYDVTMNNGNQLFDVPESDLMVDNVTQADKDINEVEWNHFQ